MAVAIIYVLFCLHLISVSMGNEQARRALDYVERVRTSPCTGGTEEVLPVQFDHQHWAPYAKVAVRMANALTQELVRNNNSLVAITEELLFDMVISNVNDVTSPIFGSAIALEEFVYPKYRTFCPYAYKKDRVYSHDISLNYDYLSNSTEWYHVLRMTSWDDAYQSTIDVTYRFNETSHAATQLRRTPTAQLFDGHWTSPYYDCGGGDVWMVTYSAPVFGLNDNATAIFRGIGTIDIELTDIDINQCDTDGADGVTSTVDIFRGTHGCQPTTKCVPIEGQGFIRGSYTCQCVDGYYFPNVHASEKYYSGQQIELYLELNDSERRSGIEATFRCARCSEGCDTCVDDSPCLYDDNKVLTSFLLLLTVALVVLVLIASFLIYWFRSKRVIKSASPIFLHIMNFGGILMYTEMFVTFVDASPYLCCLTQWATHVGFMMIFGALSLKTWRVATIFKAKTLKRLGLTDRVVFKRFLPIIAVTILYMSAWTAIGTPQTEWQNSSSDLKFKACKLTWWNYGAELCQTGFLVWAAYLSFQVRKAPSNFNESQHITWSIYNAILLGGVILILRETVARSLGPDVIYLTSFIHLQCVVTTTLGLIHLPKFYAIYKGTPGGTNALEGMMTSKVVTVCPTNSHCNNKATQVSMDGGQSVLK